MANFELFYGEACTLDNQQARCGVLFMDGFEEDAFFARNTQYEFILLSEFKKDVTSSLSLPRDYPPPSHMEAWKYYHVLTPQWNEGFAERRG